MTEKKKRIDDWMVRISFAEAGEAEHGFGLTGAELKAKLALDKIMVVRSEQIQDHEKGEEEAMQRTDASTEAAAGAEGKLNVMILDDEPIVGKRLRPTLEMCGFEVEVFQSPREALARLAEKEFDIVVTDLKMEEVDGIQVLEHVLSRCKHTRVILITGYATVEVAREALVKGAFDFIAKPFRPRDLRAVVNKAALSLGHNAVL